MLLPTQQQRKKKIIMGYANSFSSLKTICFLAFVLVGSVSSENTVCPFNYLFHTGDGFFDVGNAIRSSHNGPRLPANRAPYGMTYPGFPSGRWSDGLLDMDIGGVAMGFPVNTPSLSADATCNSVILAVARSPVLDRSFFTSKGVTIPSFAAPLSTQMLWFREHLEHFVCSTPTECADKLGDSIFMFGDFEANDIGFALTQGKSIEEARTYVSSVTTAQLNAAREVISMGGTRIVLPGSAPIGCFPYILTELASNDPADYDNRGCLRKVNDVIRLKNDELQEGVNALIEEFPDLLIVYADIYGTFETVLQDSLSGPNKNVSLKACCGTGGEYNFNSTRFCGSLGVSACADPSQYLHWDGYHLTQNGHNRLTSILQPGVVPTFHCRSPSATSKA